MYKAITTIKFTALQAYLRNTGWERIAVPKPSIALFHKTIGQELYEIILPLSKHFADYIERIADVLEVISVAEQREIHQILTDLSLPPADLVRFTVINPEIKPKDKGIEDIFIGRISQVKADPDPNTRAEGEIILNYVLGDEEKVSKARVILEKEAYKKACEAHQNGQTVRIKGKLFSSNRSKMIESLSFEIV
ncbi:MAG: hypothetical protein RLZZ628_652 [Bacteroidota bacterium]